MIRSIVKGLFLGGLVVAIVYVAIMSVRHGPPSIHYGTVQPYVPDSPSPTARAIIRLDTDYELTVEALETKVSNLEGTVEARKDKINAQRTQIAELTTPVPTPAQTPT